jgi:hypothetical protein
MAKKRTAILQRTDTLRTGPRESVIISGQCQVGERPIEDVLVTDLSARGCRLRGNSIGVTKTEPVQLWLGDAGPIAAKLKWVKKGSLGLAFESALDDDMLQPLLAMPASPAPSNVVPLRRRPAS